MRTLLKFRARAGLAVSLAVISALPVWAQQAYPSRPVQLVVAFEPGGSGDLVAGLLAENLPSALGQPVTVEHRPGASGAIGTRSVARAVPDGHTLLVGQLTDVAVAPLLNRDAGYDPERDLQPVAIAAIIPRALVVQSTAPYASVAELLRRSRSSRPGLLFASSGAGTAGHLAAELLRLRTQSRLVHVPFEGAGPALRSLLEGRVDFFFAPIAVAMPNVRAGQLKILAVSSAQRSLAVPNVPTVAEGTGVRNFDISGWVGIFAPSGTPREVVTRLNRDINQVLARPDIRDRLAADGADTRPMSVEQFGDLVRSEIRRSADLLQEEFCSRLLFGGCAGFAFVE
jgi:tripartite-type tricarboxylate transporter receptor subunit TctC